MIEFVNPLPSRLEAILDEIASRLPGEADQLIENLIDLLLEDGNLGQIANVRILSEAETAIAEYGISDSYQEELAELQQRSAKVRAIHRALSAALDTRVAIGDVLDLLDSSWSAASTVGQLDGATVTGLQKVRERTDTPMDRLRAFCDQYLESQVGAGIDTSEISQDLDLALSDLGRRHAMGTLALFADPSRARGHVLAIKVKLTPIEMRNGDVRVVDDMDVQAKQAARMAANAALNYAHQTGRYDVTISIERAATFEGNSLGLAVAVGVLTELGIIPADPYVAFTGHVDLDGAIRYIGGIREKLEAAQRAGVRRVVLPAANVGEIYGGGGLEIIDVSSLTDLVAKVRVPTPIPVGEDIDSKAKAVQISARARGLDVRDPKVIQNGVQLTITDSRDRVVVNIYSSKKQGIHPFVPPGSTPLHLMVSEIVTQVFGAPQSGQGRHQRTWKLETPARRLEVEKHLRGFAVYNEGSERNCQYRLDYVQHRTIVKQYNSGVLLLDGEGDFFTDVAARIDLVCGHASQVAGSAEESVASSLPRPVALQKLPPPPWIGTDESGKGDYFGPLVSAAVFVDAELESKLRAIGVRDSKKLSDSRNRALARQIRQLCGSRCAEVAISPERYNSLYAEMRAESKNLNSLLAWGHVRALESLIRRTPCPTVIADQFGDEHYISERLERLLHRHGLSAPTLIQMPKAESNVAVAAASILARDKFLEWLEGASRKYRLALPKGASPQVVTAAKTIVERFGANELAKVAKPHFKTTEQVMDSDEGK
jgi:ribonuclease HIII